MEKLAALSLSLSFHHNEVRQPPPPPLIIESEFVYLRKKLKVEQVHTS